MKNIRFNTFIKNYNRIYPDNKLSEKDINWLDWFIGFTEGDGSLMGYTKDHNIVSYVLTQKEIKIIDEIYNKLKLGHTKHFYTPSGEYKFSRLIIGDKNQIFLLYLLFNGNLHLEHRIDQLINWYNILSIMPKFDITKYYFNSIPKPITTPMKVTLEDAWLSGFTDAEGCFNIENSKDKKYLRLHFILDQKEEKDLLNYIKVLFNKGSVNYRKTKNGGMYRLVISYSNIDFSLFLFINYFHNFKLKTNKKITYKKWMNKL